MKTHLALASCLLAAGLASATTGAAAAASADMAGAASEGHRRLRARRPDRSVRAADRAATRRADRQEFLRREHRRRRRQCRRGESRAGAAGRLYDPGDRRQSHQRSVSVRHPASTRSRISTRSRSPRDAGGARGQSLGAGQDRQGTGGVDPGQSRQGKYASPGTGTPPQLAGALFEHALDLDLVHVPFGGGGPAVEATVGGHTPISFGAMAPAVPLIKAGNLRALAVTGKTRSPTLPDMPTMAEAGYPEVEGATWTAVVVPAGTPKEIVAKLHDMIVGASRSPTSRTSSPPWPMWPIGNSPEECAAFFKAEMAKWGKVIKEAGLKAE